MFNDILTGKATNEPPKEVSPYREPGAVELACTICKQVYRAAPGSVAGACTACRAMIDAQLAAANSAAVYDAIADHAHLARRRKIVRAILVVVIGLGVGLFRCGARRQMREDLAVGAGYHSYAEYKAERDAVYPTDEVSYKVEELADTLCRCTDLACSRNVEAEFTRYRQHNSPSDERARASVDQDTERLYACAAKLEAAPR